MRTTIVMLCMVCCACIVLGGDKSDPFLPLENDLIALRSNEGRRMLMASDSQEAFWSLCQFFQVQPDTAGCSIASLTMVLNALEIERPDASPYAPRRLFTADNLFSREVEQRKPRLEVRRSGMTLDELGSVFEVFRLDVAVRRAEEPRVTIDDFRRELKKLGVRGKYVIVNYHRSALGQEGGGHISPLGAFNAESDRVLIMDTANYKYPFTWAPVPRLWAAMSTLDGASARGFVVVTKSNVKGDGSCENGCE